MKEKKSMESHLFTSNYRSNSPGRVSFSDCRLLIDVGSYRAGQSLDCICIDYENSTMEVFETDEGNSPNSTFDIQINVVEHQHGYRYRYRHHTLPSAMKKDNKYLCIVGMYSDGSGGGVIEWCPSHEEAQEMLAEMEKDETLTRLSISWF